MSFLEMLDVLNAKLINEDQEPVSFDHDCREEYVAPVLYSLMVVPMVLIQELLLVNFT